MAKSIVDKMKDRIAKSGTSKKDILYFAKDSQKRIRFLQEFDTGYNFGFHSDYNAGIFQPCKDQENHEDCELCENEVPLIDYFCWTVWDYDAGEVRILNMKASGVSPVPSLIEMFEEFGTIMDRDYKIKKIGSGSGGKFTVTPLDKSRFRNQKVKPYTKKQILEIFDKAFAAKADDTDDDSDDDEEEESSKKSKSKKTEKKSDKKKKKEKSLKDKFSDLEMDDLKEIAIGLGMTKKEIKAFDDEEELIEEFFDNYEEDDLQELYDGLDSDEDEEDDEEDDE